MYQVPLSKDEINLILRALQISLDPKNLEYDLSSFKNANVLASKLSLLMQEKDRFFDDILNSVDVGVVE